MTNILGRSKFDKKIAASAMTVDQLVDRYVALANVVRPQPTPRVAPDPDDDVVVGTALAARAEMIVTGDKPLLSLTQHEGLRLLSVSQALTSLGLG